MKYIVLQARVSEILTQEIPIIFPNILVHSAVAEFNSMMIARVHGWSSKPVSAGDYCTFNRTCSGRSETLKLESRCSVDEALINMNDYNLG